MGGTDLTAHMIGTLAWPVVVLIVAVVFRHQLSGLFERVEKIETNLGSLSFAKADHLAADLGGALARMPPSDAVASETPTSAQSPTNMAHLMPLAADRPRDAVRAAFREVRTAFANAFPNAAGLSIEAVADLRTSVADVAPDEVIWAVTQLGELLKLYESSAEPVSGAQAFQFLAFAEGAIHTIVRSAGARPVSARIARRWQGVYNGDYRIELAVERWQGRAFTGTMSYPESGTRTQVEGSIEDDGDAGVRIVWVEERVLRGRQSIDLDGRYRAEVLGSTMIGHWHRRSTDEPVAPFRMTAANRP